MQTTVQVATEENTNIQNRNIQTPTEVTQEPEGNVETPSDPLPAPPVIDLPMNTKSNTSRKRKNQYMNPVVRQFTVNKNELAKDHCLEHTSEIKEMLEDERVKSNY